MIFALLKATLPVVSVVVPVTVMSEGTLKVTPVTLLLLITKLVKLPVGEVIEFLNIPVPLMVCTFGEAVATFATDVCNVTVPRLVNVPLLMIFDATQKLVATSFLNSDPALIVRSPPIKVPSAAAVAVFVILLGPAPPLAVTLPNNNLPLEVKPSK